MKYIRTKDGISSVESFTTPKGKTLYGISGCDNLISKDSLEEITIKEADTIEELCDLFIDEETKTIFHKHNGYVINWKTNMVYSLKALSESYHSVKGATYTDKGLIYVAKMNEKGELELI